MALDFQVNLLPEEAEKIITHEIEEKVLPEC